MVRRKCSSGGAGFEIGKYLLGQGYKVCGVRFDADKNRAEHYIATTVEELIPSAGSKYIQSYTVDGFKAVNRKEKDYYEKIRSSKQEKPFHEIILQVGGEASGQNHIRFLAQ